LAYKTGTLTGKDQSRLQRWALGYFQYMEMRDRNERQFDIEKLLRFILRGTDSKLYDFAFPRPETNDPDLIPGHSYGVDDLEGFEQLLKNIDALSTKTQSSLNKNEWSEWR